VDALRALIARLRAVPPLVGVVLTVAWIGLIWSLSARAPSDLSQGTVLGAWISNAAHGPEYAGLALWLALASRRAGGDLAPTRIVAIGIVIFCVAYGVVDELHQSSVPGRDASILDILTDLCAATSAVVVLRSARDHRRFVDAIVRGTIVCLAAAALATFVPPLAPEITWL
jgi:VanZ family protein